MCTRLENKLCLGSSFNPALQLPLLVLLPLPTTAYPTTATTHTSAHYSLLTRCYSLPTSSYCKAPISHYPLLGVLLLLLLPLLLLPLLLMLLLLLLATTITTITTTTTHFYCCTTTILSPTPTTGIFSQECESAMSEPSRQQANIPKTEV